MCWVFIPGSVFSLGAESEGDSLLRHVGFLRWLLLLQSTGSRQAGFASFGSQALELGLRTYGLSCSAACRIFPDQGSNLCSPALVGGLSSSVPREKPSSLLLEDVIQQFKKAEDMGSRKQENNEGISYGISVVGLERNNSRREIWEGKFQEKKECNEIEGMTERLEKQLRICQ